jgi:hypothetical protein
VLIDVHAGAVSINTMGSDKDTVQEDVASESGDVGVDVDSEAERFASTSRGTGKRLSRGRGGGRGNGSTRKIELGASTAAGQAANKALTYMLNASKAQKKTSLPAQFSRCWSLDHWRPADTSTYGDQPVSSRYEELLNEAKTAVLSLSDADEQESQHKAQAAPACHQLCEISPFGCWERYSHHV